MVKKPTQSSEKACEKTVSRQLVLIVDDDPSFAEMVRDVLTEAGYQAVICSDGMACLEYCQIQVPDLILLDIRMPGMDGFDVCAKLKRQEKTAHIPIMLLSGLSDPENKIRGFSLGIFNYLTKPFRNEELLARIDNILGRQRLIQETVEESKTQTLQQLSVTLADNITNPLSGIMACCQLVSRNIDDREKVIEIVEKIKESVDDIYSVVLKLTSADHVASTQYTQDIDMIDLDRLSNSPDNANEKEGE